MHALETLQDLRRRQVRGLPLPDVVLAGLVGVASFVQLPLTSPMPAERRWDAGLLLLVAVMSAALAWRRVRPVAATLASLACTCVVDWVNYQGSVADPFLLVLLYSVGAYSTRRRTVIVTALAMAQGWLTVVVDHVATGREPRGDAPLVAVAVLLAAVPGTWGDVVRERRRHHAELVEQARREERLARLEAEHALVEQRGRIARELHDVIAHHVSGIVLQAGAVQRHPDEVPRALARIRESGTAALSAMREVLGLLRTDPGSDPDAPRSPQPRLADLDDLLARVRSAGTPVNLTVTGIARALPEHLELCAYRVVQESVTNALRHAHGAAVTVRLHYGRRELALEVENAAAPGGGAAARTLGTGLGLVGMRERVHATGGGLTTGPTGPAGAGWRVCATIPTPAVADPIPDEATA